MIKKRQSYNRSIVFDVWEKAETIAGQNPKQWRRDEFGHIINFFEYGQQSATGWVVSYIRPVSEGGASDLSNLRPLWWLAEKRMSNLVS